MRVAAAAAVSATPASSGVTAPPLLPFRVGHGFDLHRLAEGYKLIIGGIDIPHTKGCEAHSDGGLLGCVHKCAQGIKQAFRETGC